MRKWLLPVIVAAILCGNLAVSEAQRQEIKAEAQEINEEYIFFYETIISNPELSPSRRMVYKHSYITFMTSMRNDNIQDNPELYEGLLEE